MKFLLLSMWLGSGAQARAALPGVDWRALSDQAGQAGRGAAVASSNPRIKRITEESRALLARAMSGRNGIAKITFPRGRDEGETVDINFEAGPDLEDIRQTRMAQGAAIRKGRPVQVTGFQIEKHYVLIDLNGGGPKRRNPLRGLQVSGGIGMSVTTMEPGGGNAGSSMFRPYSGVTLKICFDAECRKRVPDITELELQSALAHLVDFRASMNPLTAKPEDRVPEKFRALSSRGIVAIGMDVDAVEETLQTAKDPVTLRPLWGDPMTRSQVWDRSGHYFLWVYKIHEKYLFIYFDLKGIVTNVRLVLNGITLCYPAEQIPPSGGCPPWSP